MFSPEFYTEFKKTWLLAIPIIIAQLGAILMSVSDNIIVGRLIGKTALGAAGVGNSTAFLIGSLVLGGMAVLSPMVSKLFAEKNVLGIRELFSSSVMVAFIFSIVLGIISLIVYYKFDLLDQPKNISKDAAEYFFIISISNVFLYFFVMLKQFGDGLSKPRLSMYITILGLIFNIALNFLLINGLFFFPKLGLMGSAWATVGARIFMAVCMVLYLFYSKDFKEVFTAITLKINIKQIKAIFSKAIPGGFQFFFEIGAFTFALVMMGWISDTALASHQIAINIASTTYMMATGFSVAGGIRVGEAWGLKSSKGIINSGYAAYVSVLIFMTFSTILILIFDEFLLKLYIDDISVTKAALPLLSIAAFFQLSDGIQVVGLGVLRGLADIKLPTLITFLAYWVLALPLGYYLGFNLKQGASGIWWGLLIGLSFSALFLFVRFYIFTDKRKLEKRML